MMHGKEIKIIYQNNNSGCLWVERLDAILYPLEIVCMFQILDCVGYIYNTFYVLLPRTVSILFLFNHVG